MDQMNFEIKLDVIGMDLDHFIDMLIDNCYENQVVKMKQQISEQLENI